mmetsp:Transcript_8113/g.19310  ORF Transcript_8113/g.19310 Transcript_8113/m.19310 type:complete len:267 (+) Transcript_8113:2656-3456(+)
MPPANSSTRSARRTTSGEGSEKKRSGESRRRKRCGWLRKGRSVHARNVRGRSSASVSWRSQSRSVSRRSVEKRWKSASASASVSTHCTPSSVRRRGRLKSVPRESARSEMLQCEGTTAICVRGIVHEMSRRGAVVTWTELPPLGRDQEARGLVTGVMKAGLGAMTHVTTTAGVVRTANLQLRPGGDQGMLRVARSQTVVMLGSLTDLRPGQHRQAALNAMRIPPGPRETKMLRASEQCRSGGGRPALWLGAGSGAEAERRHGASSS